MFDGACGVVCCVVWFLVCSGVCGSMYDTVLYSLICGVVYVVVVVGICVMCDAWWGT